MPHAYPDFMLPGVDTSGAQDLLAAIVATCNADAAVQAAVPTSKVYFQEVGPDAAAPYAVVYWIAANSTYESSTSIVEDGEVQVSSFGTSVAQARTAGDAIHAALQDAVLLHTEGYTLSFRRMQRIFLTEPADRFKGNVQLYQYVQRYKFWVELTP